MTVGDLYPKKNISRLISAVNLIKSRNQLEENLVVVGSPLWKTADIDTKNLSSVIFTGYVSDEYLPILYQGASAFIFPSLYEGFGIPVLEAMASGIPIMLSDNTSFPEIALNAALYFDPFDTESIATTIQNLLHNRKLQVKLVAKGKNRVKQFMWRDIVKKYIFSVPFYLVEHI